MKLTYFPGCSLHSTAIEYHKSIGVVFKKLGIELAELNDWNCCGATCAHATNHYLSLALPMRNLILAEKDKNNVLAPCASCYNTLKSVDYQVRRHTTEADKVNADLESIMGVRYGATINIVHPLEILSSKDMLRNIGIKTVKPLKGLKVVAYYGCLITRPKEVVAFENADHPESMDKVLAALGADVRRWSYKTDCCGGSLALSQTGAVETLVAKLAAEAARAGAEAIVTACPLCQLTLDTRQDKADRKMPVFYFTELMGFGFGARAASNWLKRHIIDPLPLLSGY